MGFSFYRELREHMGHVYRKASGFSRKKMRRMGDPVESALRMFCEAPDFGMTLDASILCDEEDRCSFHRTEAS